MTIPMVAWMRHRGHGSDASNEMAASRLIPTAGVIAMLRRREEYTHGNHSHTPPTSASAA